MRPRTMQPPALAAVLAASAALGCAAAPAKMSFAEAGLSVSSGPGERPEAIEPEGPVVPPAAIPVPDSFAVEVLDGPPVDAVLVRFTVEERGRRGRHPALSGFPEEAIAAWHALLPELDRYLVRPLPQTPMLELVRARVTLEAEWDYDHRRYGPPPTDLAAEIAPRVARLARRIETARALGFALVARSPPAALRWPVEQAGLSSPYGMRIHPLDHRRRMHYGVDLAASPGTIVSAAAAGWVVSAGWTGGYGIMVEVRHPGDVTTRYSHLSAVLCAPGDPVDVGQPLGLVGTTGIVTGPHLHFEVWRGGEPSNPLPWLGIGRAEGSAGR